MHWRMRPLACIITYTRIHVCACTSARMFFLCWHVYRCYYADPHPGCFERRRMLASFANAGNAGARSLANTRSMFEFMNNTRWSQDAMTIMANSTTAREQELRDAVDDAASLMYCIIYIYIYICINNNNNNNIYIYIYIYIYYIHTYVCVLRASRCDVAPSRIRIRSSMILHCNMSMCALSLMYMWGSSLLDAYAYKGPADIPRPTDEQMLELNAPGDDAAARLETLCMQSI